MIASLIPLTLWCDPSFSQSKHLLETLYDDHRVTFYCECAYTFDNPGNMIDRSGCGYEPRNARTKSGKENRRARRIEWEHVMPAENFGRHLPCWKQGGRKECQRSDPKFREMEADMRNLVPSIGELNGDRSNYRYGPFDPQPGQYGQCRFEVDFKNRRALVRPEIRGDIARIYRYMSDTYAIPLSAQQRKMMEAWDRADPEDEWEREKIRRIEALGGTNR